MEFPSSTGESLFARSKTIGKTIELLELAFLEQTRDGLPVIPQRVDVGAEVAVQASGILVGDPAWVPVRLVIGRNGKHIRCGQQ